MADVDLKFRHDTAAVTMSAERTATGWRLHLPGSREYEVEFEPSNDGIATVHTRVAGADGSPAPARTLRVPYARIGQELVFSWQGRIYRFTREAHGQSRTASLDDSGAVAAPTGGVIVDVGVSVGQQVEADQQLAVIEAMKVMTPVDAPHAGTVGELFVAVGQRVEQGAPIANIDKRDDHPTGTPC